MNPLSPRLGYYVIGLGIVLQFLGLSVDSWVHGQDPELASDEALLTFNNPGHVLLGIGMGLTVAGAVLGMFSLLPQETLAALRPLVPALPPLMLGVVSIGSVVFAYQAGAFSPHSHVDEAVVSDDHSHDEDDPLVSADGSSSHEHDEADGDGEGNPPADAPAGSHAADGHSSSGSSAPLVSGGHTQHNPTTGTTGGQPAPNPLPTLTPTPTHFHPLPTATPTLTPTPTHFHPLPTATPTVTPTPCPPGLVFHPEMNHCMPPTPTPTVSCPPGRIFDPDLGRCVPAPQNTPSPTPVGTPECPPGFVWHEEMGHCMPIEQLTPTPTPVP